MPTHKSETASWKRAAEDGTKPYAMIYDHGLLIICVARDTDLTITELIEGSGFAHWRVVNESERTRRVNLRAGFSEGRALWHPDERRVNRGTYNVEERIDRTSRTAMFYREADWSGQFIVQQTGIEK